MRSERWDDIIAVLTYKGRVKEIINKIKELAPKYNYASETKAYKQEPEKYKNINLKDCILKNES